MHAPLTQATVAGLAAETIDVADDAADFALVEPADDHLLQLAPWTDRRSPRQLRKAALVQQAGAGDRRILVRGETAHQCLASPPGGVTVSGFRITT